MWFRVRLAAILVVASALLLVAPSPSRAHPHIWIDTYVEIVFERDRITGLRVYWSFDPFFSSMALTDFDADGNGFLDDDEAAELASVSAETLKDSNYFSHIRLDGELLEIGAVEDFDAHLTENTLHYAFTIPMPQPIDPAATSVEISLYDPTYYIEIMPDPVDPLRFVGATPGCIANVMPDPQRTIYFGLVRPTLMQLLCASS